MNNLKKPNAAIALAFVFLSIFAHADRKTFIEIADDQFYFGEILNGQPHGEGEMTWADGRKYEGEWKRGTRHGTGKYTYSRESTGDNYSGGWLDDKRSGFGTLTMKSGRVMEGRWVSGDFKGEAHAQTSASKRSASNASSNPFLRGLKKSGLSLSDIKKEVRRQENMGMTDSAYYLRREIAAVEGRDDPLTKGERERLLNRAMRERDSFESGSKKSVKAAQKWSSKTDRALCMDWMTAPALNLQQSSRKREIDRRGIDCWEYGNVREERRNSEQRFLDALSNIGRSGSNRAPSRQRSQSSSSSVNAPYLTNTQPVIGGVMCSYSDGSVVRRNGYNNCPRRMGGE